MTSDHLLNALSESILEFGQNDHRTVKIFSLISLNFPQRKQEALLLKGSRVDTSAQDTAPFGGRQPITLGTPPKKEDTIPTQTLLGNHVAPKVSIPEPSKTESLEDMVQTGEPTIPNDAVLSEEDLLKVPSMEVSDILTTFGIDRVKATSVDKGFAISVNKTDEAFTTNFKAKVAKALK